MKTEQSRYHKPTLDTYVAQSFDNNKQHIAINAQSWAQKNLPPLQNKKVQSYFEEDHLRYQSLIDQVNVELQFKSLCNEVVETTGIIEAKIKTAQNNLAVAQEKAIAINSRLKGVFQPLSRLRLYLAWIAVGAISLFEGLLATPVFQTWGYSLIEASCMSALFAGVLAIFAHLFFRIVAVGKTLWKQRAIATSLFILLLCLFTFMSQARADYLTKKTAGNDVDSINMHFSPLPFIFTSLLLFIISVAVCHFFLPSKEQRNALLEYLAWQTEKRANDAEQTACEAQITAKRKELSELKQKNASLLEYGSMLESLIISNAHAGFAHWKKINLMHRPDNARPISFDDANYPFEFITNFHTIKLL